MTAGMFGLSSGMHKRAILKATLGGKERARAAGRHPLGEQTLPRGLEYVRERDEHGNVVKAFWRYTEDASKVKKCYSLLFAGMSFEDIAKAVGFRTGRGVIGILRNSVWKGIRTFMPNGLRAVPLEKPMGIEPLISPAEWAKAQTILDAKRTKTRARKRQEHNVFYRPRLGPLPLQALPLPEARLPARPAGSVLLRPHQGQGLRRGLHPAHRGGAANVRRHRGFRQRQNRARHGGASPEQARR